MVNILQSMSSKAVMHDVSVALENTQVINDFDPTIKILYQYNSIIPRGIDFPVSNADINMDNSEHYGESFH